MDWRLQRLKVAALRVCIVAGTFDVGEPAVDNRRHTLPVLSPACVASEWCEFEGLLTRPPGGER